MQLQNKSDLANLFYVTVLQVTNFLIPILITPYLLARLGVASYGVYSFSLALVQYYILFVDFGFNLSATNRIAVNRNDRNSIDNIFWSTTFVRLFFTSVCWLINLLVFALSPKLQIYREPVNLMFLMV